MPTNFATEMISQLVQYFGNYQLGSNCGKIFKILEEQLQDLEETFESIQIIRDIDQAYGVHLDKIGINLKLSRQGKADNEYRKILKVEIKSNLSIGDINTIREVAEVIWGSNIKSVSEMWNNSKYLEPAGIVLKADSTVLDPLMFPETTIEKTTSGGVRTAYEVLNNQEIIKVREDSTAVEITPLIFLRSGTFASSKNLGVLL